jgi:CHAD domain-containing protein
MENMNLSSVPAVDAGVGLDLWMHRVVERAALVNDNWDAKGVHDLRVALRRCRTMADALSEVNPDAGWRKIKKSSRNLFRALGELRDTQVEREWTKKLAPSGERVRMQMLRLLAKREKDEREAAQHKLKDFGLKEWKKVARRVEQKAQLFPLESIVFQRLALAKLAEASELFRRARRIKSSSSWHRARIGLKQFRYIAENFLPRRYSAWASDVKRIQDMLGDVHDLDVLVSDLRRNFRNADGAPPAWLDRVKEERKVRVAEVIAATSGGGSKLLFWQASLEIAHQLPPPAELNRQSA